jgi:hypothetical protein
MFEKKGTSIHNETVMAVKMIDAKQHGVRTRTASLTL